MKILGLLCILLGSILLGLRYGWELELILEDKRSLLRLISLLKREIRFGNASLPECFYKIGMGKDAPYGDKLRRIYEEVDENKGETIPSLIEKYFKDIGDVEIFLSCFTNQSEDGGGLLNALERAEAELLQRKQELEKELCNRKKVGLSLGTMGGLMGILLFL